MAAVERLKEIHARAAKRHGGRKALEARLTKPSSRAVLRRIKDDRLLAELTKSVFQAGFVWRVVEAKWSGFEEAFHGFEPRKVARLSQAQLSKLQQDARIVRNPVKIQATRDRHLVTRSRSTPPNTGASGVARIFGTLRTVAGLLDSATTLASSCWPGANARDRSQGGHARPESHGQVNSDRAFARSASPCRTQLAKRGGRQPGFEGACYVGRPTATRGQSNAVAKVWDRGHSGAAAISGCGAWVRSFCVIGRRSLRNHAGA